MNPLPPNIPPRILGDTAVLYPHEPASGRIGFELCPAALLGSRASPRRTLRGLPFIDAMPGNNFWPARGIDSLAQFKLVGDPYPGAFIQGHSMRASPGIDNFRLADQSVAPFEGGETILTRLERPDGCVVEHRLTTRDGDSAFEITTTFLNGSAVPVTLEMLSSFSLGGVTPFASDDAPGRLRVHRFRSVWSAEGRLETRPIEELPLERSWSGAAAFSERFGQVGTMPVRRWFPFVAIEDVETGVVWGAQLAWAGSWQLEISRQHDDISLSGGLADREFGHWMKTLPPGESLVSPPAFVTCVQGGLDDLCDRLTTAQHRAADRHPEVERNLPIVFNEWCTTWGDPRHDRIVAIADRLRDSDVRYLVIDAGWYKTEDSDWSSGHGDWTPSPALFPDGLAATAAAIRARGLIPGLWFEMETVGSQSAAFSLVEHLLRRDGTPVTVRERRFWNLSDPFAVDYLTERVIDLLERCGFGYLKVDYNETAGIGFDGTDSLGETLRRQTLASYHFFEKIRNRLPHLVIENCASGGHRLEPSMLARTAMSSFSDAHETPEIPLIAASLHSLLLPRQSQIWAVLHATDSDRRLAYSLAAAFLGRMCLSGEIEELDAAQWNLIRQAQRLYVQATPVIKHGTSRVFGLVGPSWRHPQGWQAVRRTGESFALVVTHAFANAPAGVDVPLPPGKWAIREQFPSANATLDADLLHVAITVDFSATVVLLGREDPAP